MQFLPQGENGSGGRAIHGKPISDKSIERMLANLSGVPLGIDPEHEFRISVAGAQEKTALPHFENSG